VPPLMPPVGYVRISALRVPSGATDAGKMSRALLCASGIAVHRRFSRDELGKNTGKT